LALERSGQREEALEQLSQAIGQMRELGHEPFAHRMALEMDRIKQDAKAASRRIARFEQVGNLNWGNIARRYFPGLGQANPNPTLQTQAPVWMGVLGPLHLEVQGQPIQYSASKGRELLAFLLEARIAGRGEVGQLELFDSLYPKMDEDKAASALKQLVYRLRTALGNAAITRTGEGYGLGAVASDAEGFLQTGDTKLWRGVYLQGLGAGWDATVSESLYHALHRKGHGLLGENPEEAVRVGRILLEADPYDRSALVLSLTALEKLGRTAALEPLYRQASERFEDVGERLPERWEDFLATPNTEG
jgi:tetratricopeptide (TPR) repeat protein